MKSFILILLTWLPLSQLFAQVEINSTDSVAFDGNDLTDSCLANLNLDLVPYGILLDKAFETVDIKEYNGIAGDSNIADHFLWRRAYGTLHRAFVDSNEVFAPLAGLIDSIDTCFAHGYIPIAVLWMDYSYIKNSAVAESLLTFSGIQLFDVPERTESPYETSTCLVVAAGTNDIYTEDSVLQFMLPSSLFTSNVSAEIDFIEINFNTGNGFQTISLDEVFLITISDDAIIKANLRIHLTNNTFVEGQFSFKRKGYINSEPDVSFEVEADEAYNGEKAHATVSIRYGCGSNWQLLKPLIICEGFSPPYAYYANPTLKKNGYGFIYKELYVNHNALLTQIEKQGYDIVYVDFEKNFDFLQRNAFVLETVINTLNTLKAANGSTHKNVILGPSMGGLVARYALAHMEYKRQQNSSNPDHDTRLLVTLDSPHKGANLPLGLQANITHLFSAFHTNGGKLKVSYHEMETVAWDFLTLTCPASAQMLIYNITPANSLYASFYSELAGYNGGNAGEKCKMVAISNGSGQGRPQKNITSNSEMEPNDLMAYMTDKSGKWVSCIWALPDAGMGTRGVYYGLLQKKILGITMYYNTKSTTANGSYPLDNSPGGEGNIFYESVNLYNQKTIAFENFSFIPTFSSLRMNISDYDANVNASHVLSPFEVFRTADYTGSPIGTKYNVGHSAITSMGVEALYTIVNTHPGSTIPNGYSYNFADTSGDRLGSVEVEGILAVNEGYTIGYSQQLTSNAPPTDKYFAAQTFRINAACVSSAPEITIKNNGQLIIGDDAASRTGTLVITEGSTLKLESGSALRIRKNSSLKIENGAALIIEPNVTIELADDESMLDIGGQLILTGNNNHMTVTNQNGFIRFSFPSNGLSNITTTGTNSSIEIEGDAMTDKVVEVTSGTVYPSSLGLFKIHTGTVELAAGTGFKLENSVDFYGVKFTGSSYAYPHNGIVLTGQSNTETIAIEKCVFQFTNTAIKKESSSDVDMLYLNEVVFNNCLVGVHTISHSANLYNTRFIDCLTGWKAEDMDNLSEFKGWCTGDGETGIDFSGNSSSELFVYSSRFKDQDLALSMDGAGTAYIKCSTFENNEVSIHSSGGSFISMSPNETTTRLNSGTGYGSDNLFDSNTRDLEFYQAAGFDIEDGNNSFVYASAPPSPAFYGSVGISSVTVDGNYWDYYSTYTTLSSYNVWNVTTLSTVGYGTPTDLTTQPGNCTNWDGTIDGIISGESYSMAMPDDKSTGVKTKANEISRIIIYPNPADGYISIQNIQHNYQVKAIDITGRIISLQPTTHSNNTQSFDVSHLAAGLYQVMVEQNGIILAKQKVVVSR